MTTRRPARKQALPSAEVSLIQSLPEDLVFTRLGELFEAGWTLSSIGNAFNPPRVRSTVRSWILKKRDPNTATGYPVPVPKLKTQQRGAYVSRRPVSPGISADVHARIQELSPLARRYRSGMLRTTAVSQANDELTQICTDLHAQNVTVKELATAAGVTYRAMARRLGR
jgi:hypothetical protein